MGAWARWLQDLEATIRDGCAGPEEGERLIAALHARCRRSPQPLGFWIRWAMDQIRHGRSADELMAEIQ